MSNPNGSDSLRDGNAAAGSTAGRAGWYGALDAGRPVRDRGLAACGGFTLLEILTALAIAATIIVATVTLINNVALHFDRGTRIVSEAERLLQAADRLGADFAAARYIMRPTASAVAPANGAPAGPASLAGAPGSGGQAGHGAAGGPALFTGDASTVTFVAAGGVAVGPQGEEMIRLSVEADDEVTRLVRRRAPWLEPQTRFTDTPPGDPVVLLEGRVDISFSYAEAGPEGALTWSDRWTGESGLPRMVRVIVRDRASGTDLLDEAPFLVRSDASPACAQAGDSPPTRNGSPGTGGTVAPGQNGGDADRRTAQSNAASSQQSPTGCLANAPSGPAASPSTATGRTSG